ncbi:PD-(D/E)XK nuclease family protein [Planktothrix sp. FACHB-1355]|uniref:PD-(D/E)XK nuclease family protein n=1 Tax=Aerosakkonema funiforme FACHB-1375 TaxID=2949571 RepID=A0A926VL11_9CYAN|nr:MULTISPECIES: DNA translocase FtsK [Oscillatoriales]MBD2185867.1 PD-(D/E)XK nuclease family protein [Aerosakkonema funiforme FACHB-1375]MBD3559103.1 PD-(D/E)XK nuclease family protein [Planktothrix sp. FACHB-1355]
MPYLNEASEIIAIINKFASAKIIFADTEVADWNTAYPRLSLIQVLADTDNLNADRAYILDVLDKPDLVAYFVKQIMINAEIEKVFHNASYDLRFLGGSKAKNVTCTLRMARKITRDRLSVSNLKLKTLAAELCQFTNVDTEEQASDWGRRPLTEKQLKYAKYDTVYLAHVHQRLLKVANRNYTTSEESASMPRSEKSENTSFSVTKVRVAFECPRLFYLKQHFNGNTQFLPDDRTKGIGTIFHKLAEEFISTAKREPQFQALFDPPVEKLKADAIATQIQQLFYIQVFYPSYLQTAIQQQDANQATALHQIWQGLTKLIRHWTELLIKNRRYCRADAVISRTLVTGEFSLEHNFILPDGTQQKLIGRLDSLVFDFENKRLCVVEYKTYEPVDPSAQLAQVSLYSYMLKEKKNVPVDSAVYCVFPEFKEYRYSWEQLENTVHQVIPHKLQQMREWLSWKPPHPNPPPPTPQAHLCQICPQQEKCQSFFTVESSQPSSSENGISSQVSETKKQPAPTPDADAIAQKLVETLKSFAINVDYQGAAIGPAFIRVKLKPQLGVKVVSILNRYADLQVQLELAYPPMIAPQAGYVSVDLPRADRQIAKIEDYIQHQRLPATAPVKIAIGINLDGELVEADLSDPNTCHFLVGGTTGSGKSEFLRSLLLSLLLRHAPDRLKIALVDPKRVTFPEFEGIPWLYSPVVKDSESAISLMNELVTEMEERYRLFEAAGCPDISYYNLQASKPLPRIVCIFDEYADFMAEKEIRNALELCIKRLGAMARAAGIHLIVATQRPEAKVVTPLIRSNLPGRIALRTASEADSVIVLGGDRKAAAYLLGKGDLLYQVGSHLHRLQSLLATIIELPQS